MIVLANNKRAGPESRKTRGRVHGGVQVGVQDRITGEGRESLIDTSFFRDQACNRSAQEKGADKALSLMLEGSNSFMILIRDLDIGYLGIRLKVPDRQNTSIGACRGWFIKS